MAQKTFKEIQKFNPWIITILLALVIGGGITGYYYRNQMDTGETTETYLAIALSLLVSFWILSLRLVTTIDHEGIRMRFRPFARKRLSWSEIEHIEVLNYGFVGGWGVRLFTQYGTVYNTRGSWGIHIIPKEGKKFLIGTQKPEELKTIISSFTNRS